MKNGPRVIPGPFFWFISECGGRRRSREVWGAEPSVPRRRGAEPSGLGRRGAEPSGLGRRGAEPSGLGRRGAEPSVPTLAAQTVLRVRKGRPLTRPMYLFGLRPLHLCGTRLEGGHRRLSRTLRFAWVGPKRAAASTTVLTARIRSTYGCRQARRHRRRRRREEGVR